MDSAQLNTRGDAPVTEAQERKGISGSTVKIIAVIAMLIDHIGAVVLSRQLMDRGLMEAIGSDYMAQQDWFRENMALYYTYDGLRMIGRLGFPIFCFLLVEGYRRSRDVRKYALRLAIFALISEIPFDLAVKGDVFNSGYQNVYFTLFLGLFALCVYGHFAKYTRQTAETGQSGLSGELNNMPDILWTIFRVTGVLFPAVYATICLQNTFAIRNVENLGILFLVLSAVVAISLHIYGNKRGAQRVRVASVDMTMLIPIMYLADLLCTDYGGMGVLTITVMYIFRKSKVKSMLAGCIVLTIMSYSELPAFFALIPIAMYNGKRGLKMKYFFYAFYPVHLFLLYLVTVMMGLQNIAAF